MELNLKAIAEIYVFVGENLQISAYLKFKKMLILEVRVKLD
jgi:hypothetical protein